MPPMGRDASSFPDNYQLQLPFWCGLSWCLQTTKSLFLAVWVSNQYLSTMTCTKGSTEGFLFGSEWTKQTSYKTVGAQIQTCQSGVWCWNTTEWKLIFCLAFMYCFESVRLFMQKNKLTEDKHYLSPEETLSSFSVQGKKKKKGPFLHLYRFFGTNCWNQSWAKSVVLSWG